MDKNKSPRQPVDRHLDTPSEANRDKHINFTALENNDPDPADEPTTGNRKKTKIPLPKKETVSRFIRRRK